MPKPRSLRDHFVSLWLKLQRGGMSSFACTTGAVVASARPVLEEWGAILDFRLKSLSLSEFPEQGWTKLRQCDKGHLILDLLPRMPHASAEVLKTEEGQEEESSRSSSEPDEEDSSDGGGVRKKGEEGGGGCFTTAWRKYNGG